MKKILLIISVTFISLFVCSVSVKADTKKCIYNNPYGDGKLIFVFKSDEPEEYKYYTKKNYQNVETTGNNMYLSSIGSSISRFYVGYRADYSTSTYYSAPNSMSFSGVNWIYSGSMVGKIWNTGDPCPTLTFSSYTYQNNTTVILHNGKDSDCSSGYASCKVMELVQSDDAKFVGSCSLDVKYKDVSQKITFSSYSNGDILYSFGSGGGNKVDFTLDKPINYSFSDSHGNVIENTNIYIKKDDLKNLVKIDSNNVLTCYSATVCSENYTQYNKTLYVTTSSDKCTNPGNSTGVDVETDGEANNGGSLDPTKPSTNVSSACVDYLGHASNDGTIAHFLDNIWDIIKYGSIILVIVFAMIDFAKAASNDKEKMPVVLKRAVMRLIFLVVLLMLPTIVEALGSLAGVDGILCGIK